MFLSNPVKIFHAAWFLSIVFAGCGVWSNNANSSVISPPPPQSDYPFVVREPEIFQAEIVVRTGEIERRTFIARNGLSRRADFDVGTENHRAVVISDKEYRVFFKRKAVEEREWSPSIDAGSEQLIAELLTPRDYASFDEVKRLGSIVEYTATINGSSNSEVIIFFDEKIGLPIRQEFYSIEGEQRQLQYSIELRNFSPEAELSLFMIPNEFKREKRRGGER